MTRRGTHDRGHVATESDNQSRRDSLARAVSRRRGRCDSIFLARASTSQRARGLPRATGRTSQSSSQSKARHSFAEGFSAHRASSGSRARILAPRLARAKFSSRVAASSKAKRAPEGPPRWLSNRRPSRRHPALGVAAGASQEAARANGSRRGRAVGRFVNVDAGARARACPSGCVDGSFVGYDFEAGGQPPSSGRSRRPTRSTPVQRLDAGTSRAVNTVSTQPSMPGCSG